MKESAKATEKQKQRGKRGDCVLSTGTKERESFKKEGVLNAADISSNVPADDCPLDL